MDILGIKVFMDERELLNGDVDDLLKEAIEKSKYFAVVQSRNTPTRYMNFEAKHFLKTRVKVKSKKIPFMRLCLSSEGKMPNAFEPLKPGIDIDFERSFVDGLNKLATLVFERGGQSGILKYFSENKSVDKEIWDLLIAKANRKVMLMGHTLSGLFMNDEPRRVFFEMMERFKSLKNKKKKNPKEKFPIRVILLTPDLVKLQQLQEVRMKIHRDRDGELEGKINFAIDTIKEFKQKLDDCGENSIMQIRITDRIMYSTIYLCDSLAVITNYSAAHEPGKSSPAFLAADIKPRTRGFYSFYKEEFDRYWREKNMHPEEDRRQREFNDSTRILDRKYRDQVDKIKQWMRSSDSILPSPSLLVLYPTYKCSIKNNKRTETSLCANCIYKEKRGSLQQLDIGLIKEVLEDAIEMGVKHIQLSGGGEPLQYNYLDELLELLAKEKDQNKDLDLGLFTNGLWLDDDIRNKIASIFSYVRFSYAEGIMADPYVENEFLCNLKGFLQAVANSATPRVGLKVLLSKQNAHYLTKKLISLREEKLGNQLFHRINHLRIKAMRSYERDNEPGEQDCSRFTHIIYDHLFVYPKSWPVDTQIDLDLGYKGNDFICTVSPLFVLVDPHGSLMSCFNYLNMYNDLKIGDLNSKRLKEIWGNNNHRESLKKIEVGLVCNAKNGCPCRFANYQKILYNSSERDNPTVPAKLVKLL
jgi:MoaA/NifB/PqqE/SkfB family radical SAM enzyme